MKSLLHFFWKITFFWMIFFWVNKLIFIAVHFSFSLPNLPATISKIFFFGMGLDLSMTGYIVMANLVMVVIFSSLAKQHLSRIITVLNLVILTLFSLFYASELRLYHHWGYRADFTIIRYLLTPREAMASVNGTDLLYFLIVFIGLIVLFYVIYQKLISKESKRIKLKLTQQWLPLLLAACMILPIRGGVDVAPIGLSTAYFSDKPVVNHSTINGVWNLIYTYLNRINLATQFNFYDDEKAEDVFSHIYSDKDEGWNKTPKLKPNTNVVLIILESFSTELTESKVDGEWVTPNFAKWSKKGYSFSNFYSSGDRSDKGHVSIFCGYPALPNSGILEFPSKVEKLPNIYKEFNSNGYATSVIYGGNLDFANLRSIFAIGGTDEIIEKSAFKDKGSKLKKGKWGIHDEHTFKHLENLIYQANEPFFTCLYTLSSHEPFVVPGGETFDDPDGAYFKAANYTDSCLGAFLDQLSASPEWANTMVIVTSDHGIRKPNKLSVFQPEKFKIPLLFTGGAFPQIDTNTIFSSHTDLAATLAHMLFDSPKFESSFSKSLFDNTNSFAFYYYQVGCGLADSNGVSVYDLLSSKYLMTCEADLADSSKRDEKIKSYLQKVTSTFQNP